MIKIKSHFFHISKFYEYECDANKILYGSLCLMLLLLLSHAWWWGGYGCVYGILGGFRIDFFSILLSFILGWFLPAMNYFNMDHLTNIFLCFRMGEKNKYIYTYI